MTIKFTLGNNKKEPKIEFDGKFNISKFNDSIDKSKITKITVGSNVTDLDSKVFMDLNNLVKVELNKPKLKHYGYLTFKNCVKLNKITDSSELEKLNNSTFRNTGFTTYNCPASLKEMTNYNFKDSIQLKTVNLNNLETLGKENFKNCASLNKVTLSKNLKTIGVRSFENCHKLTTVNFNNTQELETIDQSAFYNCSGLKSIDFPKSLKTIGFSSFQNTGLENIIIPLTSSKEKITISKNAFKNNKYLKNIFLTDKTEIEADAFSRPKDWQPFNIYFYDNVSYLFKGKIENNKVTKTTEKVNVFDKNKKMLPEFKNIEEKLKNNGMIFIPPLDTVYLYSLSSLNQYNRLLRNKITINKLEFTKITGKIPKDAGTHYIEYKKIIDKIEYIIKREIIVDVGNITVTNKEDNYKSTNIYLIRNEKDIKGTKIDIKYNNTLEDYYEISDNFINKMKENKILDNSGNLIKGTHNKSFSYNYTVQSTFPKKNVKVKGSRNIVVLIAGEKKNPYTIKTTTSTNDKIMVKYPAQSIEDPLLTGKVYYDAQHLSYTGLQNPPYNYTYEIKSNWDDVVKKQYGNYKVTYSLVDPLFGKVSKTFDVVIYGQELFSTALGTNAFDNHGKALNTYNVAIGNNALKDIKKSHRNVAIGSNSMSESTVKSDSNTAVGYNSLNSATNSRNIGIGISAGLNVNEGIDNILIGKKADVTIERQKDKDGNPMLNKDGNPFYIKSGSNQIVIGNDAKGDDDSILLNQKNILPGKKNISLGDKNFKFDNIYSTKIVNGDLQLTLPTNKLSGDRYLEVDKNGNITFVTLETILESL